MEKILVTGGVSAFAQRVITLFPHDQFVLADSHAIPSPLLQSGNYIQIPAPDEPVFVHELLKRCLDLGISLVIPLRKGELLPLAQSKPLFEEYGIIILLPDIDHLQELPILSNPTHRNCPHILANKSKVAPHDGEPAILPGIYGHGENGEYLLCCIT